ncbi:hypothetical protein SDC9_63943 [bioreactor metagenome]|uniref:Uncharacterized protein n=1 Tax=bioreactor metagenome TaxID=1076179 RepID=A0A644XNI0_9ZZZZ
MDCEIIPLVAAFVEAHAPLGEADQVIFRFLKLQGIDIEMLIDVACVKKKSMSWNAEQRLRQFADALDVKIFEVLRGQNDRRFFLSDALHEITDVLYRRQIRQKEIQLVNGRGGVALGEKLIAHEGQNVEQQGVFNIPAGLQQSLDAEHDEAVGGYVGMPVEEFALGALAHGVESQQNFLQKFQRIKLVFFSVIVLILILNQRVQVREDGILLRGQHGEIRAVADAPFVIELAQHNFDHVDVAVSKILVATEKIFQERNVLTELGALPEGLRSVPVAGAAALVPGLGFQRIDHILSAHEIDEAAAEVFGEFDILMLGIKANHVFSRFEDIAEDELQKIALALAAVAEDENIGVGLVIIALVKIRDDVAPKFIPPEVKAVSVRFPAVVEGIQVGNGAGRQYAFELVAEDVVSCRADRQKALLLTKQKPVHIELRAHQLCQYVGLEELQTVWVVGGQFNVNGAVKERFTVSVHGGHQRHHILQVAFGCDGLLEVSCAASAHTVFICGVVDDLLFLRSRHLPGVDAQGYSVLFPEVPQDRLLIG